MSPSVGSPRCERIRTHIGRGPSTPYHRRSLLLATLPVDMPKSVAYAVDCYRARWLIELARRSRQFAFGRRLRSSPTRSLPKLDSAFGDTIRRRPESQRSCGGAKALCLREERTNHLE